MIKRIIEIQIGKYLSFFFRFFVKNIYVGWYLQVPGAGDDQFLGPSASHLLRDSPLHSLARRRGLVWMLLVLRRGLLLLLGRRERLGRDRAAQTQRVGVPLEASSSGHLWHLPQGLTVGSGGELELDQSSPSMFDSPALLCHKEPAQGTQSPMEPLGY